MKNQFYSNNTKPTIHFTLSVLSSNFTDEQHSTHDMYRIRKQNYQPNIITTSRQEFSLLERKMLLFCINQIDHEATEEDKNLVFVIPVTELNSNYQEIKKACITIQTKRICLLDDGVQFDYIVPFPRVRYVHNDENKAFLELTLFADTSKYFLELKNQYTRYSLEAMLQIKSLFSQRMYEIIQMHIGRKEYEFEYDVDYLQTILDCDYKEYYDFKRRVLQKSVDDIKAAVGIEVVFEPARKENRRTASVKFTVKTKYLTTLESISKEREEMKKLEMFAVLDKCNRLLANYDFSKWQKEKILNDFELLNEFLELDSQIRNGLIVNVKNPTAYLAKCLGFSTANPKKK